ncbi:hypothetical protein ACFSKU_19265 [Pontibacter silvestris]|uniref:Uncharacterized protein n=1 Tax=Pontibacter silvestris TaxID=2305183 RepID=A0ABW4X250_9BACT|nr:hypothetical protein [Pontibacter silvestris]MCC9134972.1 hypothetical protein [Pontibacter silvestris]
MEELILTYCSLIGLIVLGMLGMLLCADDKSEFGRNTLSSVDKWMMAGSMMVGIMIIHMNLLTLPSRSHDLSFIAGLSGFAFLVILLTTYTCWTILFSRKDVQAKEKVIRIAKSDDRTSWWHVYIKQKDMPSKVGHSGPKGKIVKQP